MNSNDESKLVRELRDICHSSKYNVTVFHPYFIYFDQVNGDYKNLLYSADISLCVE